MSEVLFCFQRVNPTTWVYLSSLLLIGLFFKFSRFWSVRNLDLVLLILLGPGLLMVQYGREQQKALSHTIHDRIANQPSQKRTEFRFASHYSESRNKPGASQPENAREEPSSSFDGEAGLVRAEPTEADASSRYLSASENDHLEMSRAIEWWGFLWLFLVGMAWLARLLIDPTMVRRPLLEPNLSMGGMAFMGCSLFVFLVANIIASHPDPDDLRGPKSAEQLLLRRPADVASGTPEQYGPGLTFIFIPPTIPTTTLAQNRGDAPNAADRKVAYTVMAKVVAILSHLAIVVGIVLIGYWHFQNIKMGIGAATLYLILPYTVQMTGRVSHVLPGALLVFAVLNYRRPLAAGIFLGLAAGVVYYPLFLLPLWISFYWQRGLMRFLTGVSSMLAVLALSLVFISQDLGHYGAHLRYMFGILQPVMGGLQGIWAFWPPAYRIPIITAFIALSGTLAIWPAQKNLGTLMSCSAALMVGAQLWHGFGGGLYMAWYLPLAILTVFRPNLEDRVAITVLGQSWLRAQWRQLASLTKAA